VSAPTAAIRLPRGAQCLGPLLCVVLALGTAAWAQNIRIPDLGDPPPPIAPASKPGEPCGRCGVIRSIKEVNLASAYNASQAYRGSAVDSGIGSSPPVGAVISIPFGRGADKPYVGGAGTSEMRERLSQTQYEITIQLDDGGYTIVQRPNGLAFHIGDRVRVEGTQLELLAP